MKIHCVGLLFGVILGAQAVQATSVDTGRLESGSQSLYIVQGSGDVLSFLDDPSAITELPEAKRRFFYYESRRQQPQYLLVLYTEADCATEGMMHVDSVANFDVQLGRTTQYLTSDRLPPQWVVAKLGSVEAQTWVAVCRPQLRRQAQVVTGIDVVQLLHIYHTSSPISPQPKNSAQDVP